MGLRNERIIGEKVETFGALIAFLKEEGTVFQQPDFLKAVGHDLKISVTYDDDRIVAALPLVSTKKLGIKAAHIPSYAYIFGPVISGEGRKNYSDVVNSLLQGITGYPLLDMKVYLPEEDVITYKQWGATVLANQTHIVQNSPDFGIDSIHSSKKRYLKKLLQSLEQGDIVIKEGKECNEELIWLQKQTAIQSGFKPSEGVLKRIMNSLTEDNSYSLVIKTAAGELLSGAYCPFDKNAAYHLINASVDHKDALLNRSNILTTYLATKKAMLKGLDFDFEGSNVPGVANYYRLMGGVPKLIYRIQIPYSKVGKLFFAAMHFK